MSAATLAPPRPSTPDTPPAPSRLARALRSTWFWLPLVLAVQAGLSLRPGLSQTAFDDEGLYIFMGHRMLEHWFDGVTLQESPGSYFSGSPGLYPVLAALADNLGGLYAARVLSLIWAMVATVAVFGIGNRLFGRAQGLFGAAAFVLCGSVIFQSHLAAFDSMMMALVALAAWLAVRSAQRDALLWAPAVGFLLAMAALTKYAGAVYAPVVVALAATAGWHRYGWLAVRRAAFALVSAAVIFCFIIQLWARNLVHGISQTTSDRDVIHAAQPGLLLGQIVQWVGPWLLLAAIGGLIALRRHWSTVVVLLGGAVIGPIQQIRIGEAVSLSKHVAFGMVFAAPLIGVLMVAAWSRVRWAAVLPIAAVYATLGVLGVHYSGLFLTGWVDDRPLRPAVLSAMSYDPGAPILGEQPSGMRYELRKQIQARQWNDTYAFSFGDQKGQPAYAAAIRAHYFGVIYLSPTTDNGAFVLRELTRPDRDGYYHIVDKVPRYLRGVKVGEWLVFAPREVPTRPGLAL